MTAAARRVQSSPVIDCPTCGRSAGLCCVDEKGAVRKAGPHPERLLRAQGEDTADASE
jgi:hypothetical protein